MSLTPHFTGYIRHRVGSLARNSLAQCFSPPYSKPHGSPLTRSTLRNGAPSSVGHLPLFPCCNTHGLPIGTRRYLQTVPGSNILGYSHRSCLCGSAGITESVFVGESPRLIKVHNLAL